MNTFLKSLAERRIWRVLVAYPSVTFIWLQVVEFFINNYDFDARLLTASLILAVLLFPAAVIWNWRHGEAGEQAFSLSEIAAYAIFAIVAVSGVAWYWQATPSAPGINTQAAAPARTLAVLPFENAADDAGVQFLCDGIAESLINWLATIPDIKVVAKSASFRHRDVSADPATIAEALGVDGIIVGRLEKVGEQLIVSTSFIDARDQSQLWGNRIVRPSGEVLSLEQSIVAAIKEGLLIEVGQTGAGQQVIGGTNNPAAYEHYLRGHYLTQSTNTAEIYQGLDELRQAIRLDPQYARPHADIADAVTQLIYYDVASSEAFLQEAQAAAYAAVALAPQLPEAHTGLASMLQHLVFDWDKVDAAFDAAIALSPQSPAPYHRYSDYLVFTLRLERAREMAELAIDVDSLDSSSMHAVGFAAMFDGDYATAASALGDWNRFHPNSRWSYVKHALALALDGQCQQAESQADKALDLLNHEPYPLIDAWIAWSYKVCERESRYLASVNRIQAAIAADPDEFDPGYAWFYALEGDDDALIDVLERTADTRNPLTFFVAVFQQHYPGFGISKDFVNNPRYQKLLNRLAFPPRPPG